MWRAAYNKFFTSGAWRRAYNKFFTSEAMKIGAVVGVVTAGMNMSGAHLGAYLVNKSKISAEYKGLKDENKLLKDKYKILEDDHAKYKQDKSDEFQKLRDFAKEFQGRIISLENQVQSQKEALITFRLKADARKEAIERLPFFMRPNVRRLPKEEVTLSRSDTSPKSNYDGKPTVKL